MSMLGKLFLAPEISRENHRFYVVLNYLCYFGLTIHLLFSLVFSFLNIAELAILNLFSSLSWLLTLFLNRAAHHYLAFTIVSIETFLHAIFTTYYLGWDSGFHYYLFSIFLFIFIYHKQNIRLVIFEACLIFVSYIALYQYSLQSAPILDLPLTVLERLLFLNILINFTALGIQAYFFRIATTRADRQMEVFASTDTLTQLLNRRMILEIMERETVRFQRHQKVFFLALADIDYFKKFNDEVGHDCGDYVLREVSKVIKNTLRQQDAIARWGGEEFLIMLPDTDIDGGLRVIEKLRKVIASSSYKFKGDLFSITMTFGATIFDGSCDLNACIKKADERLYEGKRDGRNCVVPQRLAYI